MASQSSPSPRRPTPPPSGPQTSGTTRSLSAASSCTSPVHQVTHMHASHMHALLRTHAAPAEAHLASSSRFILARVMKQPLLTSAVHPVSRLAAACSAGSRTCMPSVSTVQELPLGCTPRSNVPSRYTCKVGARDEADVSQLERARTSSSVILIAVQARKTCQQHVQSLLT